MNLKGLGKPGPFYLRGVRPFVESTLPTLPKKKLQVFVSSTFLDLKEERQEAVSAILKAGHIPAGMELFTAGDQSQLQVVKRWIDDSDVYMLILGTRYGSLEPVSGLSYTEVEYDYACSKNKPLFAVILNDDAQHQKFKDLGSTATEASHGDKLATFRTKVMSKMCSLIGDRKEIKASVYESLIDYGNNLDLIGWVPGNLLEDTRPLRERIAELEAENARLQAGVDAAQSDASELAIPNESSAFENVRTLLKTLDVTLPADIATDKQERTRNIGGLFLANRNLFVRDWNIGTNPSASTKWFENEVFPPLIVHRLIASEPRTGGGRRYVATEKGLDFLAWIDRRKLDEKASGN
jgi:hypothetical protein